MGVSIEELAIQRPAVAAEVTRIALSAYALEARLIGREDFPPLRRTVTDYAHASTRFFGSLLDGELASVIEVDASGADAIEICSLVTCPEQLRKGMARELLRHVADLFGNRGLTVSTATANTPALCLYASFGFRETSRWTSPDGFELVALERAPAPGATV